MFPCSVDPLYTPIKEYVLVKNKSNFNVSKINHIKKDINKVIFNNEQFDYIFSCNAFQHISNLDNAFKNFYKWLKPGGILYSHFGPIWSAPDGSHIEGFKYKEKIYNFWSDKLIPYWSHIYFNQKQMIEFLSRYYTLDFAKRLTDIVYNSSWINRLKYSDYCFLVKTSMWDIIDFKFTKNIDYNATNYLGDSSIEFFERDYLNKITSNQNKENWNARDILMVIRKI